MKRNLLFLVSFFVASVAFAQSTYSLQGVYPEDLWATPSSLDYLRFAVASDHDSTGTLLINHSVAVTLDASVGRNLDVTSTATIGGNASVGNDLDVGDDAVIGDDLQVSTTTYAGVTNYCLYSEQMEQGDPWSIFLVSVDSNVVAAPDGTTTAESITVTDDYDDAYIGTDVGDLSFDGKQQYASSMWVRGSANCTTVSISMNGGIGNWTGEILSGPGNGEIDGPTYLVTGLTSSEWTHVRLLLDEAAASAYIFLYPNDYNDVSPVIGHVLYVWGGEVKNEDVYGEYITTTSTAVTAGATAGYVFEGAVSGWAARVASRVRTDGGLLVEGVLYGLANIFQVELGDGSTAFAVEPDGDVQITSDTVIGGDATVAGDVLVTGTLTITTGTIPDMSGPIAFDSTVSVAGTASLSTTTVSTALGIATASPDLPLSVAGDGAVAIFGQDESFANVGIRIGEENAANKSLAVDFVATGDYALLYIVGDSAQIPLVIDDGGNIGIRVVDPDAALEVNGTFHATGTSSLSTTTVSATLDVTDDLDVDSGAFKVDTANDRVEIAGLDRRLRVIDTETALDGGTHEFGGIEWESLDGSGAAGVNAKILAYTAFAQGQMGLRFYTGDQSAGVLEHMSIDRYGAVMTTSSASPAFNVKSTDADAAWVQQWTADDGGIVAIIGKNSGDDGYVSVYNGAGVAAAKIHSDADSYVSGGNFGIGDTTPDAEGDINGALALQSMTTPTAVAGHALLYAADVGSGETELWGRDDLGNSTKLTSHNENNDAEHRSFNDFTGIETTINLTKLALAVEAWTGRDDLITTRTFREPLDFGEWANGQLTRMQDEARQNWASGRTVNVFLPTDEEKVDLNYNKDTGGYWRDARPNECPAEEVAKVKKPNRPKWLDKSKARTD